MRPYIPSIALASITLTIMLTEYIYSPAENKNKYRQQRYPWIGEYGKKDTGRIKGFITTKDGGLAIFGRLRMEDGGIGIIKIDASGREAWRCKIIYHSKLRRVDRTYIDQPNAVKQTKDGGYIICGNIADRDDLVHKKHEKGGTWIVRLDSKGTKLWEKKFKGKFPGGAGDIAETVKGGFIFIGPYNVIFCIDIKGRLLWTRKHFGDGLCQMETITPFSGGRFVILGFDKVNTGRVDQWVLKIDSRGKKLMSKIFRTPYEEEEQGFIRTADGGMLAYLGVKSVKRGNTVLLKFDPRGNKIWEKTITSDRNEWLVIHSAAEIPDGGFLLAGTSQLWSNSADDFKKKNPVIIKIDKSGKSFWKKITPAGRGDHAMRSIMVKGENKFSGLIVWESNTMAEELRHCLYRIDFDDSGKFNKPAKLGCFKENFISVNAGNKSQDCFILTSDDYPRTIIVSRLFP